MDLNSFIILPESIFASMYSILAHTETKDTHSLYLPNPILVFTEADRTALETLPVQINQPRQRVLRPVTQCPHPNKKHYAKGMCSACYHKYGRKKTAWDCEHPDQKLYALGKCHLCYIKAYSAARSSINHSTCLATT